MFRFATVVCAAASVFPDDLSLSEGLHLLQLKVAKTSDSESYAGGEAKPYGPEPWNEASRDAVPWKRYKNSKVNCHVKSSVQGYLTDKSRVFPKDLAFEGNPHQIVAGRCRPTGRSVKFRAFFVDIVFEMLCGWHATLNLGLRLRTRALSCADKERRLGSRADVQPRLFPGHLPHGLQR